MYRGLNDLFPLIKKWWRTGSLMDFLLLIPGGDDDFHVGNDDAALSSRWYFVFLVQTASGHWLHCQFRGSPTWWPILSVYGSPIYDQPRIAWICCFLLLFEISDRSMIIQKNLWYFRIIWFSRIHNISESFWGPTLADPPFHGIKTLYCFVPECGVCQLAGGVFQAMKPHKLANQTTAKATIVSKNGSTFLNETSPKCKLKHLLHLPPIFLAKLEWILFIGVVTNEEISSEQRDGEEETASCFFSAAQNIRALIFLSCSKYTGTDFSQMTHLYFLGCHLVIWLPK